MFFSYIHYLELMQKYTSLQGDYMATHKLYVHSGRSTRFAERERASVTEDVQSWCNYLAFPSLFF